MSSLDDVQVRFLELLVARQALRFGSFTLKSGRASPYFINTGCFHHGGDLAAIGSCYAAVLHQRLGSDIDVVFGPAYKGIPLALATAQAYEELVGRPVGWTFDRKEAKTHGDSGGFVGAPLAAGARVAIVDDVMTAGTALRTSLAKLADCAITVAGAVISVDRQERGQGDRPATEEIAAEYGIPVQAIITIDEAVAYLAEHSVAGEPPLPAEEVARIRAHRTAASGG